MNKKISRFLAVLLCCFVFLSLVAPVCAEAADYPIRRPPLDQDNDPNDPDAEREMDEQFPDGMFRFEKRIAK